MRLRSVLAFWTPRVLVAAAAGLCMLAPVLTHAGWPYNHDGLRPLLRIAEAWGQWHAGHLLPIWSNASQFGLGSPGVLLYHKLFGYAGALVRFVLPGPKRELCVTLFGLMVANALGVGRAVRSAAGGPCFAIEALCGVVAVSCNYAFIDWMTRGAVAEFSAYCVLPWLFAWCFDWLRTGQPSLAIGPLVWLLWMAHAAIATFVWVLLLPAVAVAAAAHGVRVWRASPRLAGAIGIFVLMSLPWALAAVPMIAWAQVTNMISVWRPETTHVPFARIFDDRAWSWNGPWWGFTPQLDPVLILALAVLPPAVALSRAQRFPAALCLLTAVLALALQLRAALPLYRLVPPFEFIAFTWRLLTYASMALAIGLGVVLLALAPRLSARAGLPALLAVLLVAALVGKPRHPAAKTPWFGAAALALGQRGIPSDLFSVEYPEYLPRTPSGPGHPRDHWQAAVAAMLCAPQPIDDRMVEAARLRFRGNCPTGHLVAIDEFLTPGMRLLTEARVPVAIFRTCDDPRVRFVEPATATLLLRMPTLGRALHDWWVHGPAYPACHA